VQFDEVVEANSRDFLTSSARFRLLSFESTARIEQTPLAASRALRPSLEF
jgi:hypothetical protein